MLQWMDDDSEWAAARKGREDDVLFDGMAVFLLWIFGMGDGDGGGHGQKPALCQQGPAGRPPLRHLRLRRRHADDGAAGAAGELALPLFGERHLVHRL